MICFSLLIYYSSTFKEQHMAREVISASTTKYNLFTKKGNSCLFSRSLLFMTLPSENKNVIENDNKPMDFCDYPRNTPISVLNQPIWTRWFGVLYLSCPITLGKVISSQLIGSWMPNSHRDAHFGILWGLRPPHPTVMSRALTLTQPGPMPC